MAMLLRTPNTNAAHRAPSWGARFALAAIVLSPMMAQSGTLPVTGMPVPQLSAFDIAMQAFMVSSNLNGGVLAVSRNGCIIYQRGFGYVDSALTKPMPENTPMRIASLEKPLTAALVRDIANDGIFSLTDQVFDPNLTGAGILPAQPYSGNPLGTNTLTNITVGHLLLHQGGWCRDVAINTSDNVGGDPSFQSLNISTAMGTYPVLPGRFGTAQYMLAQGLNYTPGSSPCGTAINCTLCQNYSNFGYMLLGMAVEQVLVVSNNMQEELRRRILTPGRWVPATEVFKGETQIQNPREPYYHSSANPTLATDVFDPGGANVDRPYGAWHLEMMQGHGNLVASAAPLLKFLDNYFVGYYQLDSAGITNNIGMPLWSGALPISQNAHTGGFDGTDTIMSQGTNGINIVVLFNDRKNYTNDSSFAMANLIRAVIAISSPPIQWPTFCVDGFWVEVGTSTPGFGGYNDPFDSVQEMLDETVDGSRVHFKPGADDWTGVMTEKMFFDAPEGPFTIGTL